MEQAYTPHLKKVLKSYQQAATTSLHGPNNFMATWRPNDKMGAPTTGKGKTSATGTSAPSAGSTTDEKKPTDGRYMEYDPFLAPPPFPIQQPPIITPSDQSRSERSETILEGETISCFIVGGEKRLCLPQILNTVLRDFSLQQINSVCDDLHIFCSRCNPEQLDVLKMTGILPASAPSCGLITKTDAERLCAELLRHCSPKPDIPALSLEKFFSFKVYHECFGKCTGIYTPDLYTSPSRCCVECIECHCLFTPQKFVCHAHKAKENRTCHWGFDSANWRAYLHLSRDQDSLEELQEHLEEMKLRFEYPPKYKRKQITADVQDPTKRFRTDDSVPYAYPYPLPWDPPFVYWCPEDGPWTCVSAFKPWSAVVSKDEKGAIMMPPLLSPHVRENNLTSLPAHLSHDPPVLQNPERVVPLSESKRFERHFQPNVALAPVSSQNNPTKTVLEDVPKTVIPLGKNGALEEKAKLPCDVPNEIDSSSSLTDGDDAFSDCSISEESNAKTFSDNLKNLQHLLEDHKIDEMLQKKILREVDVIITRCQTQAFRSINKRTKCIKSCELKSAKSGEAESYGRTSRAGSDDEQSTKSSKSPSPESCPAPVLRTASRESPSAGDAAKDAAVVAVSVPNRRDSRKSADSSEERRPGFAKVEAKE